MSRYSVIVTGASGSVYGLRLIEQLLTSGHEVIMTFTDAGRDVCGYETGFDLPAEEPARALLRFLELPLELPLRNACCKDLFDPIASGSYPLDGVIVCPASMGFVAKVAHGLADNLPTRAADSVRSSMYAGSVKFCIHVPTNDSAMPTKTMRKSRYASAALIVPGAR